MPGTQTGQYSNTSILTVATELNATKPSCHYSDSQLSCATGSSSMSSLAWTSCSWFEVCATWSMKQIINRMTRLGLFCTVKEFVQDTATCRQIRSETALLPLLEVTFLLDHPRGLQPILRRMTPSQGDAISKNTAAQCQHSLGFRMAQILGRSGLIELRGLRRVVFEPRKPGPEDFWNACIDDNFKGWIRIKFEKATSSEVKLVFRNDTMDVQYDIRDCCERGLAVRGHEGRRRTTEVDGGYERRGCVPSYLDTCTQLR
jgi:hypothetical protein